MITPQFEQITTNPFKASLNPQQMFLTSAQYLKKQRSNDGTSRNNYKSEQPINFRAATTMELQSKSTIEIASLLDNRSDHLFRQSKSPTGLSENSNTRGPLSPSSNLIMPQQRYQSHMIVMHDQQVQADDERQKFRNGVKDIVAQIHHHTKSKAKTQLINETTNENLKLYFKSLSSLFKLLPPAETQELHGLLENGMDEAIRQREIERDLQIQELGGGTQELQGELERLRAEMALVQANEQEQRLQMRDMSHKIDEKDELIEQLRWQIQQQSANYRQLFKQTMTGKGESEKMSQEEMTKAFGFDPELYNEQKNNIDQLHKENIDLRELLMELQKDIDYGKQRENKLIFFLYVLKENGLPVSDVFDAEIKDLPTTRFSKDFNDDYKLLHSEIRRERELKGLQIGSSPEIEIK